MRKYKLKAKWRDCPGVINDGKAGHAMRDGCHNCAPWWERYPVCGKCERRVTEQGWCKRCQCFNDVDQALDTGRH